MIVALYNNNYLVFINEMECVYCAVRAASLNMFQVHRSLYSVKLTWVKTLYYPTDAQIFNS